MTGARTRGRPRTYDPGKALSNARDAFWQAGFSGTSLDTLSDATDMNRPSMYAAFGDKHALYLKTLALYVRDANRVIESILSEKIPLADALKRFYEGALAWYLPTGSTPRGCYLIGTAATEAATDAEIRSVLLAGLRDFDRALALRIERAQKEGELPANADTAALAEVASAMLYKLAVRSRAGDSRASLKSVVAAAVRVICGKDAARGRKK